MRSKILLIVLCWFPFCRQYCQSEEYAFSHLDFSSGLSSNRVTAIFKDDKGFMWFGTVAGLNRYDGYQFKIFRHDPHDPNSIRDNYIEQIFEGPGGKLWVESRAGRYNLYDPSTGIFNPDYLGYLRGLSLPESWLLTIIRGKMDYWFVYRDNGIYHMMPDGKIVAFRHSNDDKGSIDASIISSAKTDGDGNCWVIHRNGFLEKIDGYTNKIVFSTSIVQNTLKTKDYTGSLFIDKENDIWLYSNGVFKGVYYYRPATGEIRHLWQNGREGGLSSNLIGDIIQDNKGLIWLGADHGGVNVVDKKDLSVKTISHIYDDSRSLADISISTMFQDHTGTLWLGTFRNGIAYYDQDRFQFQLYRHQPSSKVSLSYDDIGSFVEDAAGNIWMGSNGGGLIYFDRRKSAFHQYLHDNRQPNSLSSNIIVNMLMDRSNKLWIGTYFGGLDCFDGKTFTHYRHDEKDPNSLADDRVMCIYEDDGGQLWIGTLAGGMDRLDREKKIFYHYNNGMPHSIFNNYVSSIAEDSRHNLWVATGYGIDVLERDSAGQPTSRPGDGFVHYSSDNNRLASDNVNILFRDSRQHMWVGTREGLSLFDPIKKSFRVFNMDNGLPDNTIRSIVEDRHHDLWISTANGVARLSSRRWEALPGSLELISSNFHEPDGLQGREFNDKGGLATRDGYILFGGANGFNIFDPARIVHHQNNSPIVLTDLQLFNKSIQPGQKTNGRIILDKSLDQTEKIVLGHNDNVFSLEFASLDFSENARNKYAYKLEGFDKNWLITNAKSRKATYTNLDPGEYTFRVKASDEDEGWNEKQASLKVVVLPPFWKTDLAFIIYTLAAVALLYFARKMVIRRAQLRFSLQQERQEAKRMHEIDMMKIRFFTNMSHELRTPLSLIIAPVEKLITHPSQPDRVRQYELIRRNARRLLNLVNQLLDFRKMEVNELRLHPREGDVLRFIKEVSLSFIDLAEKKNIAFTYESSPASLITLFDHDKLERILFNLLSNAFKFTPENGAVHVHVSTEVKSLENMILQIRIRDTGIGIAADKQEKIFERFFQTEVPNTILNQGSGIGLAISMEFVRMHQGSLSVESEVGKGSCFTVRLPLLKIESGPAIQAPKVVPSRESPMPRPNPGGKKKVVLIVEDNEDFRFYLKDNLQDAYVIHEAEDGKEGWRKALALQPDLVVSDISMPLMDGIELCRKIRSDERTNQLPVILLTALAEEGTQLRSLETGANDYISKPFNFEILHSKIRSLLDYQETIKKTYQRRVEANPAAIEVRSADDLFLQSVLQFIENNMANADLSVEAMTQQFHSSRSTFYKRLLLITGKTPVEFIRHIRLKRAAELLEKSQMTVAEIAYAVGFNNPKYFTAQFKLEFDRAPSVYRAEKTQHMG